MSSFTEQTSLNSPSGAALNLYHMSPGPKPRAIVQINHGLAEHAARYENFARYLAGNGFAVFAHDHRGHGKTRAADAPTGVFSKAAPGAGWAAVTSDTLAVHDHAASLYPGVPVITFGHSMGGMIAMNFALSHPSRQVGVAVWNANFQLGAGGRLGQAILATERMFLGSDVPSRMMPKTTFDLWGKTIENAQTPFDWLSHDKDQVRSYIDDPGCGWNASVALWQDIIAMGYRAGDRNALGNLPRTLPIQLVGGSQDPATNGGVAVSWYANRLRQQDFSNVTLCIYENLRHETLNEHNPGAAQAMDDFLNWSDAALRTLT